MKIISDELNDGSSPEEECEELSEKIKAQGKKVVLDTSGALLKESIKACPTMVKPNTDEIEDLLGIKVNNHKDLVEGACSVSDNASTIAITTASLNGLTVIDFNVSTA